MTETPKETGLALVAQSFKTLANPERAALVCDRLAEMGVGQFELQRLKVPSGGQLMFMLDGLSGPQALKTIDVAIIAAKGNQKAWWRDVNPSPGSPPDCSSDDGLIGIGKNTLDPLEIAARHECASCPWNQFESKRGKGAGKDCSDSALLFFFREGSALPNVISVPATSLKAFRTYSMRLLDADKSAESVVTRIGLEADKSSDGTIYAKLRFDYVQDLPAEMVETNKHIRDAVLAMRGRRAVEIHAPAPAQVIPPTGGGEGGSPPAGGEGAQASSNPPPF